MRRRLIGTIAIASSLSLLAAACAAEEGSSDAGDSDVIRIGANYELFGPAQALGTAYKNAIEIAAEDINEEGVLDGRKIELIIRDNKSDPDQAVQVANDLIKNEGIVAMVGPGTSPTSVPTTVVAEREQIPMISTGSSGAITTNPDTGEIRKWVFKTTGTPVQHGRAMLEEAQRVGVKTVGLLTANDAYGNRGEKQAIKDNAAEFGVEIVANEKFDHGKDKDMTAQVTKLMAADPDAIMIYAIFPSAGIIAQNIRDKKFAGKVYFDAGAGAELFLKDAAEPAEGMYMVHPQILAVSQVPATTPAVVNQKNFFEAYSQAHGSFSGFASYAADALHLIVEAIEQAGSTEPAKIRDALEQLYYEGLTGPMKFAPDNHSGLQDQALTMVKVRDGGWVLSEGASEAPPQGQETPTGGEETPTGGEETPTEGE